MSVLLHQVSQTPARMELEQARRLDRQDMRLNVLERQVEGCQDLQNESEQVFKATGGVIRTMAKMMMKIRRGMEY